MKDFVPRPWQPPGIDHILKYPRGAVFARPGTGKTSMVLSALDYLDIAGVTVWPTLVVAPLRVARDVWVEEPVKWNQMQHLKVSAIVGTLEQRRAAMRRPANVYTINYEQLPWLIEELGGTWPYKVVVADESGRLRGYRTRQGGKRAHALASVAMRSPRWINLTGTPAPNGLQGLWGQQWYVDFGERLGRTYSAFTQRWFQPNWNGFGIAPLPHADREIHEKLRGSCIYIDLKDYISIADPIITRVPVNLPDEAMRLYKEMEKKLYVEIQGKPISAVNAGVKSSKLQQISNGACYFEAGSKDWMYVHQAKLDALESLVNEAAGMPVLVGYSFVHDLERLQVRFKKDGLDISTAKGLKEFKAGRVPVGFAHPQSLGHGVDGLQNVTNFGVMFGHDWNFEYRDQFIERIGPTRQLQAGLDRGTYIYDLVGKGTIDTLVLDRHISKATVQDALTSYLNHQYGVPSD